jgi:hypothetical protein
MSVFDGQSVTMTSNSNLIDVEKFEVKWSHWLIRCLCVNRPYIQADQIGQNLVTLNIRLINTQASNRQV